jgi:uncharacterized protein (UPF0332 family)
MKNYILRAEDEIESAKYLYQNDFYRGTLNHCYYACTWLMRGLLAERGIVIKMLDSAFSFFEEYIIKSEPVPNSIQQFIKMLVKNIKYYKRILLEILWQMKFCHISKKRKTFCTS